MSDSSLVREWIDKLQIRDIIERSVRYIDDGASDRFAELFDEDGVMQLAGTIFEGREALRAMLERDARPWTDPGELLKQPGSTHLTSNPVVDVDGDTATAETDMVTLIRDENGRAKITLVARYRDRFRRAEGDRWLITSRTGVSIARPGEAGTDAEWARALGAMSDDARARFRTDG